jgi:hypothetical protein
LPTTSSSTVLQSELHVFVYLAPSLYPKNHNFSVACSFYVFNPNLAHQISPKFSRPEITYTLFLDKGGDRFALGIKPKKGAEEFLSISKNWNRRASLSFAQLRLGTFLESRLPKLKPNAF